MYFVPEGQYDRSQARSAWEASPKEPSRRVRYDRAQLIPEVFLVESPFRTEVRAAVRCDRSFPEYIDFFCSLLSQALRAGFQPVFLVHVSG
jgi:hypothetical protein